MKHKLPLLLGALIFSGLLLVGCGSTPATGWIDKNGSTYYADANGDYLSGWQEIDGKRYFFGQDGAMATGWLETDEGRYFLNENGIPQTGWITVYGEDYCFAEDGRLVTGWTQLDGKRCYLDSDGTIATGWLEDGGLTYYLDEDGCPSTGWLDIGAYRYYFQENGCMLTGWAQFAGQKYYFRENGIMATGWAQIGDRRYFFEADGNMITGWLNQGDVSYYLQSDGSAAVGPTEIGGTTYYFSPGGVHVPLVNPWHKLPEGYHTELTYIDAKQQVASSCYDALMRMMEDCKAAGHFPMIISGYRTQAEQEFLFNRKIKYFLDLGYSRSAAEREAAKEIAVPGTSEHQLGLAVDIMDSDYPYLDDYQAETATQQWLMEHCYEYGFILRYPNGTTDITGIIFEPWHYRYVGLEVANEIRQLGITLEEYVNAVENG